jgi:hypothetical protein
MNPDPRANIPSTVTSTECHSLIGYVWGVPWLRGGVISAPEHGLGG